mmetsp:Transcript_45497/g.87461  ORF Transcript_45497/g.87461 Transcript_45497/m.87461 type:complete len:225 (+) Transcript_45497:62-736(+)
MLGCVSAQKTLEDGPDGEESAKNCQGSADLWCRIAKEERRFKEEQERAEKEVQRQVEETTALQRQEDEARERARQLAGRLKEAQRAFRDEQSHYEQLKRERELAEHTAAARQAESKRMLQERGRWVRKTAVAAFLRDNGFTSVNEAKRTLLRTTYPLHLAAEMGNARMVEMLIREGAELTLQNSAGRTALQVAREENAKGGDSQRGNAQAMRVLAAAAKSRGGA